MPLRKRFAKYASGTIYMLAQLTRLYPIRFIILYWWIFKMLSSEFFFNFPFAGVGKEASSLTTKRSRLLIFAQRSSKPDIGFIFPFYQILQFTMLGECIHEPPKSLLSAFICTLNKILYNPSLQQYYLNHQTVAHRESWKNHLKLVRRYIYRYRDGSITE